MMRFLPSVLVAITASALSVFVNVATDLHAWWSWVAVAVLTGLTALLSARGSGSRESATPASSPTGVRNVVRGDVSGQVIQAGKVDGDITFGPGRD